MVSLDFLEKVEVFNGLDDSQLNTIKECVEMVDFKRGERIFTQGDDSTHVWIVVEGDVELRTEPSGQDASSAEPTVSFLSEAHAFGWTCHAPPYKYQLSGYCASRMCKVIKLKREDLNKIFENDEVIGSQIMFYLLGVVGKQFEQLQDEIAKKRGIEIMSQW
jgi:CRP-like cAMP-binding protein